MKHYIYEPHQSHREVVGVDGGRRTVAPGVRTHILTPVCGLVSAIKAPSLRSRKYIVVLVKR